MNIIYMRLCYGTLNFAGYQYQWWLVSLDLYVLPNNYVLTSFNSNKDAQDIDESSPAPELEKSSPPPLTPLLKLPGAGPSVATESATAGSTPPSSDPSSAADSPLGSPTQKNKFSPRTGEYITCRAMGKAKFQTGDFNPAQVDNVRQLVCLLLLLLPMYLLMLGVWWC